MCGTALKYTLLHLSQLWEIGMWICYQVHTLYMGTVFVHWRRSCSSRCTHACISVLPKYLPMTGAACLITLGHSYKMVALQQSARATTQTMILFSLLSHCSMHALKTYFHSVHPRILFVHQKRELWTQHLCFPLLLYCPTLYRTHSYKESGAELAKSSVTDLHLYVALCRPVHNLFLQLLWVRKFPRNPRGWVSQALRQGHLQLPFMWVPCFMLVRLARNNLVAS
jgi:hypothetical protein